MHEGRLVGWLRHGRLVVVRARLVVVALVVQMILVGRMQRFGVLLLEVSVGRRRAVVVRLRLVVVVMVVARHGNGRDGNVVQL